MDDLLFLTDTIDTIVPREAGNYELLPVGIYQMTIIGVEMKDTKALTGKYLELTLEVASGPHAGRRHWDRLNLQNPNAQTQAIAQESLKRLKDLCGIKQLTSSMQFLGQQIPVKVDQKKRKDQPDVLENVVYYNAPQATQAAQARPAVPQGAPAAAAAAGASQPTWRSRATALA